MHILVVTPVLEFAVWLQNCMLIIILPALMCLIRNKFYVRWLSKSVCSRSACALGNCAEGLHNSASFLSVSLLSRTIFLIIQAIANTKLGGRGECNASGAELTTDAFPIISKYKSPKKKKYNKNNKYLNHKFS